MPIKEQEPDNFCYPHAIIVEGQEDQNFILNFLRHLKLDKKIYIHHVGGSGNLNSEDKKLRSLRLVASTSNFKNNVKNLAIIFDRDGEKNKFNEIKKKILEINSVFSELEFYVDDCENVVNQKIETKKQKAFEIKTFIFLMNDSLEDLFIKTLSEQDLLIINECVPKFFECSESKSEPKRVVQAFLSTKYKQGLSRDIGSASSNGIIDFNNSELNNLRNFLIDFSNLN